MNFNYKKNNIQDRQRPADHGFGQEHECGAVTHILWDLKALKYTFSHCIIHKYTAIRNMHSKTKFQRGQNPMSEYVTEDNTQNDKDTYIKKE